MINKRIICFNELIYGIHVDVDTYLSGPDSKSFNFFFNLSSFLFVSMFSPFMLSYFISFYFELQTLNSYTFLKSIMKLDIFIQYLHIRVLNIKFYFN